MYKRQKCICSPHNLSSNLSWVQASYADATLPEVVYFLALVLQMKDKVKRLHTIWMDGGYRGEDFAHWIIDIFRWIVEVVVRPLGNKGFTLLPKPWVVQRTFGWLNWCRRLSKDYERLPETSETLIYIAMVHLMMLWLL